MQTLNQRAHRFCAAESATGASGCEPHDATSMRPRPLGRGNSRPATRCHTTHCARICERCLRQRCKMRVWSAVGKR